MALYEFSALIIVVRIAIGIIVYLIAVRRITETDVDKSDHWRWRRK